MSDRCFLSEAGNLLPRPDFRREKPGLEQQTFIVKSEGGGHAGGHRLTGRRANRSDEKPEN